MSKNNKNRNQNNQNTDTEKDMTFIPAQPMSEEELKDQSVEIGEKVDEMTESVDIPAKQEDVPVEEPVVEETPEIQEISTEDDEVRGFYVRLGIRYNIVDKTNALLASIGAKEVSMYDYDFVSGPYKTEDLAKEISKKIVAKGIRVKGIAECA